MSKAKSASVFDASFNVLKYLGAAAFVFIVLGYAIVQVFLSKHQLEGMFWLSQEFYTRAGWRFVLDVVKSPFFGAPIFFGLLLILAYFLKPKKKNIEKIVKDGGALKAKQFAKMGALALLLSLTILFELFPDKVLNGVLSGVVTTRLFNIPGGSSPYLNVTVAFFCLTLPILIMSGVSAISLRPVVRATDSPLTHNLFRTLMAIFACALVYLPISYGQNIYDWHVAPLVYAGEIKGDGNRLELPDAIDGSQDRSVFLLGEFDDKYVFLRVTSENTQGILESVESSNLQRLIFDAQSSRRLSSVLAEKRSALQEDGERRIEKHAGVDRNED
jgi:hypothetical protein